MRKRHRSRSIPDASVRLSLLMTLVVATVATTATPIEGATRSPQPGGAVAAPTMPRPAAVPFTPGAGNVALVQDVRGGQAVLREGSVSQLVSQTVSVGGRRQVTIGALADQVLDKPRQQHAAVVAGRAALFADPVMTEQVEETADATILTARSTFTIVNRGAAQLPEFTKFTPRQIRLQQLSPAQRQAFDTYKASLSSKPTGHPLREALARSDQALLDALGSGVTDVTRTVTIRVDKTATNPSGHYAFPNAQVPVQPAAGAAVVQNPLVPAHGTASGTVEHTAKFLTGWTLGDALHWSEKTDFGFAWVEVGFHAGYTLGLRVPVVLKATMTPTKVERGPGGAYGDTYDVTVHDVAAVDAGVPHYSGTGLDADLVAQGRELVMQADAYAFAKGEVFGAHFSERFPGQPLFDQGRQMQPPFGACGTACGLNFFFPCNATKTCINIAGIVKGGAEVGFNLGGTGTVSYDYQSLVDGRVVASQRGNAADAANVHWVSTDGTGDTSARFHTQLPATVTKPTTFGYRLSNPTYAWHVALTPLVQATASFDYLVGEISLALGPYPLPISIELGTIELPTHAGTQLSADRVAGQIRVNQRVPVARTVPVQGTAAATRSTTTTVRPAGAGTSTTKRRRRSQAATVTRATVAVTTAPPR